MSCCSTRSRLRSGNVYGAFRMLSDLAGSFLKYENWLRRARHKLLDQSPVAKEAKGSESVVVQLIPNNWRLWVLENPQQRGFPDPALAVTRVVEN